MVTRIGCSPSIVIENGAPGQSPGARSVCPSLPCETTFEPASSAPEHEPIT